MPQHHTTSHTAHGPNETILSFNKLPPNITHVDVKRYLTSFDKEQIGPIYQRAAMRGPNEDPENSPFSMLKLMLTREDAKSLIDILSGQSTMTLTWRDDAAKVETRCIFIHPNDAPSRIWNELNQHPLNASQHQEFRIHLSGLPTKATATSVSTFLRQVMKLEKKEFQEGFRIGEIKTEQKVFGSSITVSCGEDNMMKLHAAIEGNNNKPQNSTRKTLCGIHVQVTLKVEGTEIGQGQ